MTGIAKDAVASVLPYAARLAGMGATFVALSESKKMLLNNLK